MINSQKHALIWSGAYPTFFTLAALTLLALIIYSYRDANSLSPLANVFCISGILGGVVLLLVFDNQLQVASFHTFFLLIYSFHLLWVRIKGWQEDRTEISYENRLLQWLHRLLNKSRNWPWLAVLVALPTLALVVLVLMLFGQQPDSMIKAWTNTADWAFSQRSLLRISSLMSTISVRLRLVAMKMLSSPSGWASATVIQSSSIASSVLPMPLSRS